MWLGSLLVLDSELLGWEEVFFPVEATVGNWAGTSPISFTKCPACRCLLGMALWPEWGTLKGAYVSGWPGSPCPLSLRDGRGRDT